MCSTCNNADIVMTELAFYLNFFVSYVIVICCLPFLNKSYRQKDAYDFHMNAVN